MSDFIYRAFSAKTLTPQNAKEYNLFKKENNLIKRKAMRICGIERLQGAKIALTLACRANAADVAGTATRREGNGCGSVGVSIGDCGSPGPGSNPGRGPLINNDSDLLHH